MTTNLFQCEQQRVSQCWVIIESDLYEDIRYWKEAMVLPLSRLMTLVQTLVIQSEFYIFPLVFEKCGIMSPCDLEIQNLI